MAKDLITGMLKTNQDERLTIDQVLKSKWISQYNLVPETPLLTSSILNEDEEGFIEAKQEMSQALTEMRVDLNTFELKTPSVGKSKLAEKRRQAEKTAIPEEQMSQEYNE